MIEMDDMFLQRDRAAEIEDQRQQQLLQQQLVVDRNAQIIAERDDAVAEIERTM